MFLLQIGGFVRISTIDGQSTLLQQVSRHERFYNATTIRIARHITTFTLLLCRTLQPAGTGAAQLHARVGNTLIRVRSWVTGCLEPIL